MEFSTTKNGILESVFYLSTLGWLTKICKKTVMVSHEVRPFGSGPTTRSLGDETDHHISPWLLHPRKLTCPLKRHYLNRKYIFQPWLSGAMLVSGRVPRIQVLCFGPKKTLSLHFSSRQRSPTTQAIHIVGSRLSRGGIFFGGKNCNFPPPKNKLVQQEQVEKKEDVKPLAILLVTFLGWLSDPLKW